MAAATAAAATPWGKAILQQELHTYPTTTRTPTHTEETHNGSKQVQLRPNHSIPRSVQLRNPSGKTSVNKTKGRGIK